MIKKLKLWMLGIIGSMLASKLLTKISDKFFKQETEQDRLKTQIKDLTQDVEAKVVEYKYNMDVAHKIKKGAVDKIENKDGDPFDRWNKP